VSVCPSVSECDKSRGATETAKRTITQATPHDSTGTLENLGKIQTGSPPTEAQNAGAWTG